MKFNLANKLESVRAIEYLAEMTAKEVLVEIKKISPTRSLSQNSYLHLIIAAFGNHFGYSAEEAKQIYKELNSGIYKYTKKGRVFWRSSAELTKEEMAKTIGTFMEKSKEHGYPLPLATDQEWLIQISNEIERAEYYL
jgi:hypothetical protein